MEISHSSSENAEHKVLRVAQRKVSFNAVAWELSACGTEADTGRPLARMPSFDRCGGVQECKVINSEPNRIHTPTTTVPDLNMQHGGMPTDDRMPSIDKNDGM